MEGRSIKKWLLFLARLALTGGCLWWALKGVDWEASILSRSEDIGWGWVAGGLVLAGLMVLLTTLRLWVLLRAQGIRIRWWRAVELTLIGELFNWVAVGGIGGDAARIFLLIRDHPERKLAVTLTVMFDHLVGLVAMSLAFFVLTATRFDELAELSFETQAILKFGWVYFSGGLGLVALMFLVAYPPVHEQIHKRGKHWKIAFMRRIPEAFDVYREKWRHALVALACGLVMLPVYYASFWCGARAAGEEVALGPVLAAMPVIDALSGMPVSVAGVGVREASMTILMKDLTGMAPDAAVATSLIGTVCTLAWALVGGLLFLRPRDRASAKAMEEVAG